MGISTWLIWAIITKQDTYRDTCVNTEMPTEWEITLTEFFFLVSLAKPTERNLCLPTNMAVIHKIHMFFFWPDLEGNHISVCFAMVTVNCDDRGWIYCRETRHEKTHNHFRTGITRAAVLPSAIRNTVFTVAVEFLVRKHQPTYLGTQAWDSDSGASGAGQQNWCRTVWFL